MAVRASATPLIPRTVSPFVARCGVGFPAIALVGPRQSGKSSLARTVFPGHRVVVLESPDMAEAAERAAKSPCF